MSSSQSSLLEHLNTVNMTLHPLSDNRTRVPCFISNGHPIVTLDDILLLEINIEPFLPEALPGGLDREGNIVLLCLESESDRLDK